MAKLSKSMTYNAPAILTGNNMNMKCDTKNKCDWREIIRIEIRCIGNHMYDLLHCYVNKVFIDFG